MARLMGAGRTELAMSLFGHSYGTNISGTVYKNEQRIQMRTVDEAIKHGFAYATEDRKQYGLNLIGNITVNVSLHCHAGRDAAFPRPDPCPLDGWHH